MSTGINSHDVHGVWHGPNMDMSFFLPQACQSPFTRYLNAFNGFQHRDLTTFEVSFAWWAMQSNVATWVDTSTHLNNLAHVFLFDSFCNLLKQRIQRTATIWLFRHADVLCHGKQHTARVPEKATPKLSWWWTGCDYDSKKLVQSIPIPSSLTWNLFIR